MKTISLLFIIGISTLYNVSFGQMNLDFGLKAYYPFSGSADDFSGNQHDAYVSGASLCADRFGNPSSAYYFDGYNDFINTNSTFDFQERSVSVWVKTLNIVGSNTTTPVAITQDDNMLQSGILRIDFANGNLKLWAGGTTGTYTTPAQQNVWYHFVLIRSASETIYYINGEEVFRGVPNSVSSTWQPNSDFIIGMGRSLYDQAFKGYIDEVCVYDRVISECEVQALYNGTNMSVTENLKLKYSFTGNAIDESGNQHDGEVVGATLTTDRFGHSNSAYSFDGQDDFIQTHSTFDFENRALSLWVKPNISSRATDSHVAVSQDADALDYGLMRVDYSTNKLNLWAGGAVQYFQTNYSENEWQHIVLMRDNLNTFYFINNQLVSVLYSDGNASTWQPNPELVFGIGRDLKLQAFKGSIDDIRLYDKVLTPCEINELYYEQPAEQTLVVQLPAEAELAVYPNPSTGLFYLDFDITALNVEIYNISGARVKADVSKNSINLKNYSSGIYFLRISDESGAFRTLKIVKQE